jgi:[glutamine synthetase] adenylyltransferase / [glutamine synthetase]-adenylyl-L-tyrosine phosphorylase
VQYLVLAHAHAYRDLLRWSDNMRLLDLIAEHGLLVSDDAHVLQETYIAYRSLLHKRALDNAEYRLTEKEFSKERAAVIRLWDSLFAGIEPGPLHEGSSGATGP